MHRVAVGCCLIFVAVSTSFGADGSESFDSAFGERFKQVKASTAKEDDAALAAELLKAVAAAEDLGYRQILLEKTNELTLGCRGEDRKKLAQELIDAALPLAEAREQAGKYEEVAAWVRRLAPAADAAGGNFKDEWQRLGKRLGDRQAAVKKLEQLQSQAKANATDAKLAGQIVSLLVLELNRPAEAVPYATASADEKLRRVAALAAKPCDELTEEEALVLAEWCRPLTKGPSELARLAAVDRARVCYERFLKLHEADDAARQKVRSALDEIEKLARPGLRRGKTVNLLALVDLEHGAIAGEWKLEKGDLICTAEKTSHLRIGYQPPEEYDYRVEFTRREGKDEIGQLMARAGKRFHTLIGGYGNNLCGIGSVGGQNALRNDTTKRIENVLTTGKRHMMKTEVRRDHISLYLDGKLLTQHKTDWSDISQPRGWEFETGVGLLVGRNGTVAFHKIEITEIDGAGKVLAKPK